MSISVYSIAYNEVNRLRPWFESVKEADQVVLVVTGSQDGTYELAMELADDHPNMLVLCVPFVQPVSYSLMRQLALDCCTQDLCMWIDCDETWDAGWYTELRAVDPSVNEIHVQMVYGDLKYFQCKGSRRGTHYWKYNVHEVLHCWGADAPYTAKFCTHHNREAGKEYRNLHLELLERDLAAYPRDPRVLFYYLRQRCYNFTAMVADKSVAQEVLQQDLQDFEPIFQRLQQLGTPFTVAAALELSRALSPMFCTAGKAVVYASIAYAHTQCLETCGQLAAASYFNGQDLNAIGWGIQTMGMAPQHNLMFDESAMYLDTVPFYVVKSCLNINLLDKALFYANQFNRMDLIEQAGIRVVEQAET